MPLSTNDYAYIPAHFTFANVNGLTLRNLKVGVEQPGHELHAIYGANLEGVIVDGFRGKQALPGGKLATIHLEQCRDVFIRGSVALPRTGTFLHLEGRRTQKVSVIGSDLSEAKKAFESDRSIRSGVFYQSANRLPD